MSGDFTRKRISAEAQMGTAPGAPGIGNVVFGGVFVGLGLVGILASAGVFGSGFEAGRRAPHWVFAAFGCFAIFIGAWVMGDAIRLMWREKRKEDIARHFPGHPARLDYPWNEEGFVASSWPTAIRSAVWFVGLSAFLMPFNYFVFGDSWRAFSRHSVESGWGERLAAAFGALEIFPALIVGIFDVVIVALAGQLVLAVARAVRFGRGRMTWDRFPIAPGEEVELRFELPRVIRWFETAEIDLRCVEESWQESRQGKNRRATLVHEQVWADRRAVSGTEYDLFARILVTRFVIPAECPPVSLSGAAPVFWRADLRVKLAGPDYVASFLVPVYAPSRSLSGASAEEQSDKNPGPDK